MARKTTPGKGGHRHGAQVGVAHSGVVTAWYSWSLGRREAEGRGRSSGQQGLVTRALDVTVDFDWESEVT